MKIERDECLFMNGFGEIKFSTEDYTIRMTMSDGRLQTGVLEYNEILMAPTGKIFSDGKSVNIDFDFSLIPVTGENWERIRRLTDGMMEFYNEFLKQFGSELMDDQEV